MRRVLHWLLRLAPRAVTPLLILIPLAILLYQGFYALLRRTDAYLSQATPLINSALSQYLQRPVHIGRLTPNLTTLKLYDMIRHPETYGKLPVQAIDISVGNRRDEIPLAAAATLATANQVTLYVSLPAALSGDVNNILSRVVVDGPELVLVRDPKGVFNLQRFLPPQKKSTKVEKPFRTVVEINNARVRFRDYAAHLPALPAINDVVSRNAVIDLSATHTIDFSADGQAVPGSITATRLGGIARLTGTLRRDDPTLLPPADAAIGLPLFSLQASIQDADLPYWLTYILKQVPLTTLRQGRGDADIALMIPDRFPGRSEPLSLNLRAAFRRVDGSLSFLPMPFENASGTLELADGLLRFRQVQARVLGESAAADGAVWNLPPIAANAGNLPPPAFHVVVNSPRLPVNQAIASFLPGKGRLPKELTIGGMASAQATITGRATHNLSDVNIVGRISGASGTWRGLPGLQNIAADINFSGGVLQVSNGSAALVGGGRLLGKGAVRLVGPAKEFGDASFAGRVDGVDLSRLSLLASLNNGDPATRLRGIGSVEAIGQRQGGKLDAAANLYTQNLYFGKVPVPVANARVIINDNRVLVTAGRLESPVGLARISGESSMNGGLNLRFAVTSLDLQAVGRAVGFDGAQGTVSAQGTVTGTAKAPLIHVNDLFGFNLRVNVPADKKTSRQFAVDLIRTQHIEVSWQRLRLLRPLMAYRFPARAQITGEVLNLAPSGPKKTFDPRFHLLANVENVSYEEIQRQIAVVGTAETRPPTRAEEGEETKTTNVSTSIALATVHLNGTLSDPHITGQARLRTILIGPYPLTSGSLTFDYNKRRTLVENVVVQGDIGTVKASASLAANGTLSGKFTASSLDMEKLSYLTKGRLLFQGTLSIAGQLSGNLDRPVVVADLSSVQVTVAGTTYSNISGQAIRFVGGERGHGGVIQMPALTLEHNDIRISVTDVRYDLQTGDVAANLTVKNGDVATVLDALQHSGIEETKQGAGLARVLASLPSNTNAQFDVNQFAFRGRIVKGVLENPQLDVDIDAHRIVFGEFNDPNQPIDLVLKGTLRDKVVAVSQFRITRPGATIRGDGTYDPDGQVDAYIESNDASLDIIRSVRPDFPLRGSVDFSVYAKGSSKNPHITASLLGRDLFYVVSGTPGFVTRKRVNSTPVNSTPVNSTQNEYGVDLSLFRVEAEVSQSNPGEYNVSIKDALVRAANVELSADALIPITTQPDQQSVARRPLRFNIRTNTIDLKQLVDYLHGKDITTDAASVATTANKTSKSAKTAQTPDADIGGTVTANISYGGSLENPALSGAVTVADAHYRLPRTGNFDRLSPVTNFDATLRLAGSSVFFDQFLMKLGGVNGQRGDFGSLNVSGGIQLQSLAALERILRNENVQRTTSLGVYDLTLAFKGLRPVEDNLLGLGEGAKARVDGNIRMTGDLLRPTIATAPGEPLRVTQAEIRTPSIQKEPTNAASPPPFNPDFRLEIALPEKSVLTNTRSDIAAVASFVAFRFELQGFSNATITGHIFPLSSEAQRNDLEVFAELTPVGGYFQLPTARFKVQKGGKITVRYGKTNPGIYASDVVAEAKVAPLRGQVVGGLAGRDVLTTSIDPTPVTRYDITMTLDGTLISFDERSDRSTTEDTQKKPYTFVSDPYLSSNEIESMLFGKNSLDQAQNGRVEDAIKNFGNFALANAYLPGFVSQFTDEVGQRLGLEDLTLDYDITGNVGVSIRKRLNPPFNRFIIAYSRAIQQRETINEATPFRFSFSYELYQFKANYKIQPRLQLGFRTDEQHNDTYFLQGVVNY